jgi:hypothetical protein
MRDIMKLLFGTDLGDEDAEDSWDGHGRRARVADSREWCGSTPGEDGIAGLAAALGGRRGRSPMKVKRARKSGPFGW